jgi:hypothetical protein
MKKHSLSIIICALSFLAFSSILYYTIPNEDGHRELDSGEYEPIAKNFAKTGNLCHPGPLIKMPCHTVGYHFFLGIFYRIFGLDALPTIIFTQVLLGLFCCFLIYGIALKVFGPLVALVSLACASFNLGILVYAQLLMADVLMLTFLLGFLYMFVCFVMEQNIRKLAAAAVIMSLSVIIKPVALYFIFPLLFFIWFAIKGSLRLKATASILFALFFYVPLLGYMTYNYTMYGVCAVTTLVRENLYVYFLPRRILPRLDCELQSKLIQQIESACSEVERMQISETIFNDLLKNKPLLFCFAWCESMFKTFFGIFSTQLKILYNGSIKGGCCSFFAMSGKTAFEKMHQYACFGSSNKLLTTIAYVELVWLLLRYILIVIACIMLFYAREYFWLLFFACYSGYFTFVAGHDGGGRYRIMFEALLIILAAYAIVELYYIACNANYSKSKRAALEY